MQKQFGIRVAGLNNNESTNWHVSEYLAAEEDMAAYINATLEVSDTTLITSALDDIASASEMTQTSKETIVTRNNLYKALSPTRNPSLIQYKSCKIFFA
ncbi:MAG: addiction module antidote protein [Coriobacteriales bacterium]|jgi:probable addiction module antidote protein